MRGRLVGGRSVVLGAALIFLLPAAGFARSHHASSHHRASHSRHYAARGARVIQCVAFARAASEVDLAGNAKDWWYNARGVYARGQRPEPGAVLSFAPTGRMRLGHVAVVSDVVDGRTILIDQSHWASGGVSRDVRVVDVSEANDWTAVRVELGHTGTLGSIYPTHGFIYARPDDGRHTVVASAAPPAHAAPEAGLRGGLLEVAEAPAHGRGLDLTVPGIAIDAPNRALQ